MEWLLLFVLIVVVGAIDQAGEPRRIQKRQERQMREAMEYEPPQVLGGAGFTTDEELKHARLLGGNGILCGYSDKSKEVRYKGEVGVCIVAPAGSGKGTCGTIPNILSLDDQSLVVFCPKGETPSVTVKHRKGLGPCHIVNPYQILPKQLGRGTAHFNPMDILSDPDEPAINFYANCTKIAEGCMFHETRSSEGEFWSNAARNLISGVIMGVAKHEPKDKRNLVRVAEIISTDELWQWSAYIFAKSNDPYIKAKLGPIASGNRDDRTIAGVIVTAQENISFIQDAAIAECIRYSDFRWRSLRKQLMTVFITMPVANSMIGGRFFKLITSSMLGDMFHPGKAKRRVSIILDETFSIGASAELETAVGISRGFGVSIWTVWQDINQMVTRYPHSWQTFLSNSGVRIFMTPQDQNTAKYVSEQCGITTVSHWGVSVNQNDRSGVGTGQSIHVQARPLFHPHEVRAMPSDKMFVFIRGLKNVVLAKRIPYYKVWNLRRKALPNPFYQ